MNRPKNEIKILFNTFCVFQEIDSASQLNVTEEDKLFEEMKNYEKQLIDLESAVRTPPNPANLLKEGSTISAETMMINELSIIKSIDVDFINNINIPELLDNVLDLNEGFEINKDVHFKSVFASEPIIANKINNVDKNMLLHTDDDIGFDELSIEGDVHCQGHLKVAETINNIKFDSENVLLKNGDQNFTDFSVEHLVVDKLRADNFDHTQITNVSISSIEKLKVKDLVIGGYMNGVKISTLNKYALRNSGDQDIIATCYFNHLEADNLETKELSGN